MAVKRDANELLLSIYALQNNDKISINGAVKRCAQAAYTVTVPAV